MTRVFYFILLLVGLLRADLILDDWSGVRVDSLYTSKSDIYKLSCEQGNLDGCYSLGFSYIEEYAQNKKESKYLDNGVYYLKYSCDNKMDKACFTLGVLYLSQDLKNEATSADYLGKSCMLKNNLACSMAAKYYEEQKDMQKVTACLSQSCNNGVAEACAYVGILYHDGSKVGVDCEKARVYYLKSITLNPSIPSNYLNIFELDLVQNRAFDIKSKKEFLKRFGNQKSEMVFFDMLTILQNIANQKSSHVDVWEKKYQKESLKSWDFGTIDSWVVSQKNSKIQNNLQNAVAIFKKKAEK